MSFEIQCFEERLRGERGEKVEGKNRRDEEGGEGEILGEADEYPRRMK